MWLFGSPALRLETANPAITHATAVEREKDKAEVALLSNFASPIVAFTDRDRLNGIEASVATTIDPPRNLAQCLRVPSPAQPRTLRAVTGANQVMAPRLTS